MTDGLPEVTPYPLTLKQFHESLAERFDGLASSRAKTGAPVFALEHGLGDTELDRLNMAVRACVADDKHEGISRRSWLPFLVYAVEIAYDYAGLEYWQGFTECTPRWKTTDRGLLRDWYLRFHDEFRGAEPKGDWAAFFKNISWPITNAVLPVYLQRQLAQLLYEDRGMIGTVQDPDALGVRLAGRAFGYGRRFRQFCQNTTLLGTVASSLLLDQDESSHYLTDPALARIVRDVQSERQARIWLGDARAARRVNTRGFVPVTSGHQTAPAGQRTKLPKPELSLQRRDKQWELRVALPDLRMLAERLPEFADALSTARPRLLGRDGYLARGRLLEPGQVEVLTRWPDPGEPLLTLDRCPERINDILGDFSLRTAGPWWVFRQSGNGQAGEVRGKDLRPGVRYVLLTVTQQRPSLPWIQPVDARISGVSAFEAVVPDPVPEAEQITLKNAGLSFLSNIIARPVGLVAASWDGQGDAEWIVGEPMMIGINAEQSPATCSLNIDGQPSSRPWPENTSELILNLQGLTVGEHDVSVALLRHDESVIARGSLAVVVRDTPRMQVGGTPGEGIRIRVDPTRPTLDDLWNPSTTLTVEGPAGAEVRVEVDLKDEHGDSLLTQRVSTKAFLPIGSEEWRRLAVGLRKSVANVYDDAQSCVLSVSKDGLGFAQVTAARPFRRLFWRLQKPHGGKPAVVRLVDQTDSGHTTVRYYSPSNPVVGEPWLEDGIIPCQDTVVGMSWLENWIIPREGGLVSAETEGFRTSVLLPADPNWLMGDAWKAMSRQRIPSGGRRPHHVLELIDAYQLWSDAELPGDPFAEMIRRKVQERIDHAVCALITGGQWANDVDGVLDNWTSVVIPASTDPKFRDCADAIRSQLYRWDDEHALIEEFPEICEPFFARHTDGTWNLARFVILLAARPGSLSAQARIQSDWDGQQTLQNLSVILANRLLYQLARIAVIARRQLNENGDEA